MGKRRFGKNWNRVHHSKWHTSRCNSKLYFVSSLVVVLLVVFNYYLSNTANSLCHATHTRKITKTQLSVKKNYMCIQSHMHKEKGITNNALRTYLPIKRNYPKRNEIKYKFYFTYWLYKGQLSFLRNVYAAFYLYVHVRVC
jgi:hypothetical protein